MNIPPTFKDVEIASERLAGYAIKTPVLESDKINDRLNCRVLIKAENIYDGEMLLGGVNVSGIEQSLDLFNKFDFGVSL